MKFEERLDELRKLKLPADKFAVFGNGPLSVRGLKDAIDLHIIVKKDVWDVLDRKFMARNNFGAIILGNIEVVRDMLQWFDDLDTLIDDADIIDGIRYVKLEHVLKWKKEMNREKDKNDIKIIEEFLKARTQQ
jgi:hypothetical protein